jgi:hypothetical protein
MANVPLPLGHPTIVTFPRLCIDLTDGSRQRVERIRGSDLPLPELGAQAKTFELNNAVNQRNDELDRTVDFDKPAEANRSAYEEVYHPAIESLLTKEFMNHELKYAV